MAHLVFDRARRTRSWQNARHAMGYQKTTQHLTTHDGTSIAVHTHRSVRVGESDAAQAAKPAVLLTSGIGTSENFWRYLVDALRPDYRVVHWDYRGHGESGVAATGDYAMTTQARDLAQVTEAVIAAGSSTQPPLQVAFSMGVAVLLELYRARPELVPAMALIAGAPDAPGEGTLPFKIPGVKAALKGALNALTPLVPYAAPVVHRAIGSPFVYPVGRALGLLRKRAPREDIDTFMQALRSMDPIAYWQTLRALMEASASDVLPEVKVPVLIVGASHDTLVPRSQIERMREALPAARWLLVEDAGHAGLLEAGPEVASALLGFLSEMRAKAA